MTLIASFGRLVALLCKNPWRHIPNPEFATLDPWITDEQWLAGLPAAWSEPVGWGWWRAH